MQDHGLKSPYNRQLQGHELRPLLNLGVGCHLPVNGQAPINVNGTMVYVKSLEQAKTDNPKANRPHRIFAICKCGAHVPAGRMYQHKCH